LIFIAYSAGSSETVSESGRAPWGSKGIREI
jgi:hypothetical protein